MNLEERLRAKILLASEAASVSNSSKHTPSETSVVTERSHSPSSTPLPDSPVASPRTSEAKETGEMPQASEKENSSEIVEIPDTQPIISIAAKANIGSDATETSPVNDEANPTDTESDGKDLEEDIKAEDDPSTKPDPVSTNSQEELPTVSDPSAEVQGSKESDIEALQTRLRQVEQRFSGW